MSRKNFVGRFRLDSPYKQSFHSCMTIDWKSFPSTLGHAGFPTVSEDFFVRVRAPRSSGCICLGTSKKEQASVECCDPLQLEIDLWLRVVINCLSKHAEARPGVHNKHRKYLLGERT